MAGDVNKSRRTLLGASALGLVAAQLGTIASANAQESNNHRISAPGTAGTSKGSFGPLKHVNAGVLSIAYAEARLRTGNSRPRFRYVAMPRP